VVASAPKSSGLTYGQNLSAALLSGGAATNALGENVAGSFSFLDPTLIPAAGTTNVQAVFTPTELANYKTASVTVAVTVDKQTPTVSAAPSVTDLTYGQCFGSVSLSGGLATNAFGAGVAGTFAFADPAGVPKLAVPAAAPAPPRILWHDGHQPGRQLVEVRASDRTGLLAVLTAVFERAGVDISWAKITTLGSSVIDVFAISAPGSAAASDSLQHDLYAALPAPPPPPPSAEAG
jgi:hypothetical protein